MQELLLSLLVALWLLSGCGELTYDPATNDVDFEKATKPVESSHRPER